MMCWHLKMQTAAWRWPSGSEAASNVAQLVLLDSDFSRMPSVVAEGRRVVNNIERTAALYIVKNIFSMLLAIFSVILMLDYPLEPSQVSLISMFTIGIPSFVLALEPNKELIRGHFSDQRTRAGTSGRTDGFYRSKWSGDFLPGISGRSGLSVYIMYHSGCNRWFYDSAPHCKTDEYRTYCNAGRCDCRMDSLHAVWQKLFRNYGNFQTV